MARQTYSLRLKKGTVYLSSVALLLMLIVNACGGSGQKQPQANQSKATLDKAITNAQSIGVPITMLQPIIMQEEKLSQTSEPLELFSTKSATDYYTNLAQRYQMLSVQVRGLESQVTQQMDYQATLDLRTFASLLAQRQSQGFVEAKPFADKLTSDQNQMARAQFPRNYLQISASARQDTQALRLMGPAYDKLTALQNSIKQMRASRLDTTALDQQVQNDLQLFRAATKPDDFNRFMNLLDVQLQETMTISTGDIPYVGQARLKQFSSQIDLMKQYGQDTSQYQKRLDADKAALASAKSLSDYLKLSAQVDSDEAAIQLPLLQSQASYLLKQFHQEVADWGNAHQYHDPNNGQAYKLDYEYDQQGIGSDADAAVQSAQTQDDYQAAVDLLKDDMLNLKAMEADYNDKTSWDQSHQADIQLMQHYNAMSGQTIVVSLTEQALRFYQDGKLVKAFQITSGQYDKPSPPGFWHIFLRQSPTVFKSSEPQGSAFWYPDTNINYAMEYRTDGYYFHDSWWRKDYGPGTNFPHSDSGGDITFAGNGSHGCINMQENQAGWLYSNTAYGTAVIIY